MNDTKFKDKCKKKSFNGKEQAVSALHLINNSDYFLSNKKPNRYYLCDKCGKYHLSSTPSHFVNGITTFHLSFIKQWRKLIE